MPLPITTLATSTVTIGGEDIPIRSMSRRETLLLGEFDGGDKNAAEVFILQCGTGCSEEEATAFRDGNDARTAGLLIDGIAYLSGLASSVMRCPECEHEGTAEDFTPKDADGAPKTTRKRASHAAS